MFGLRGLDHHFARRVAPSGASGHLRHQLEGAFGGAEIGCEEQVVGVEDAYQRDPCEVEPFGNHLRADQQVALPALEAVDNGAVGAFGGGRVAVEPLDARRGEEARQLLLDLLGAESRGGYLTGPARRTADGDGFDVAAVVALEAVCRACGR